MTDEPTIGPRPPKRRRVVLALAFLLAAATSVDGAVQSAPPRAQDGARSRVRNLVVVTLDTVRADRLGCYGYFRETTPHLDALARECLRFTNCLTPIAQTTPSHATLFTGVGPIEHGVLSNHLLKPKSERDALRLRTSPQLQTLAQVLRERGVKTGGFVGAAPLKRFTGLDAGFEAWSEPAARRRVGAAVVADALAFLDRCGEAPFFAWVHVYDAHAPFEEPTLPRSYLDRFHDDAASRAWRSALGFPERVADASMGDVAVAEFNDHYDGALRFMDDQLGALLERLAAPALRDTTALVVVADHGTGAGQHSDLKHGLCWDEQLRVPLLVRLPGVAPRTVDVPLSTIDLWPTFFALAPELAEARFERQCRGHDALAASGEARPLFALAPGDDVWLTALTTPRWKFVRGRHGDAQLFDRVADPHELVDVAASERDVVAELGRLVDAELVQERERAALHRSEPATTSDPESALPPDPTLADQLRALGYPSAATDDDASTLGPVRNLVVVTLDTARADHLGCYGYGRDTTPNLDALARESLRFARCLVPISQTTPSHLSLFTGVAPYEHGVLANHRGQLSHGAARKQELEERRFVPSPTLRTLAQALQRRGFATGGFSGAIATKSFTGLDAGFERWTQPRSNRRTGAEVVADALDFVDHAGGRPFFVWLHLYDAHGPFAPPFAPEDCLHRYHDDAASAAWRAAHRVPTTLDDGANGPTSVVEFVDHYDGALRFLDDQFGVLLRRLADPALRDHTALVVVGSVGAALGQHSELLQGECWDEQFRVPLLIRLPGVAPRVVDVATSTLDLWPTLFALAPRLADPDFQRQCRGHDALAADFVPRPLLGLSAVEAGVVSLTTPTWKLIRPPHAAAQLFDLANDPNEWTDVAARHADVVAELSREVDAEIAQERQAERLHHARPAPASLDEK